MAKIVRKLQKQFGGGISPSGNIAKFGSLAAGTPEYSSDPVEIQSYPQFLDAWQAATVGVNSPAIQDRNALDFLFAYQLRYLLQQGLAEWDAGQEYAIDGFCAVAGVIFVSKTNANIGNDPLTDTNNWKTLASTIVPSYNKAGLAKFFVRFNGHNGTILGGFNVDSVIRESVGTYLLNLATTIDFSDENYAWSGSCSPANGGSPVGGNNNCVIGGGLQTTLNLRVINYEYSGGPIGPEDGDCISVIGFGN